MMTFCQSVHTNQTKTLHCCLSSRVEAQGGRSEQRAPEPGDPQSREAGGRQRARKEGQAQHWMWAAGQAAAETGRCAGAIECLGNSPGLKMAGERGSKTLGDWRQWQTLTRPRKSWTLPMALTIVTNQTLLDSKIVHFKIIVTCKEREDKNLLGF